MRRKAREGNVAFTHNTLCFLFPAEFVRPAKDQVSSSDWVTVFQDVSDAQTALSGVEDHGHGLQFRMATIADIRQKAFNRWGPSPDCCGLLILLVVSKSNGSLRLYCLQEIAHMMAD